MNSRQNLNYAMGLACCTWLLAISLRAAELLPLQQSVGNVGTLAGWQGLNASANPGKSGASAASLAIPGEAVFTYPNGPQGWYQRGFRIEHDGTSDWRDFFALQLDVKLVEDRPVALTALVRIPPQPVRKDFVTESQANVVIRGAGWHTVTLPWSSFDFQQAQPSFLKFVKELHVSARFVDGQGSGTVLLGGVRLIQGEPLVLRCDIRGLSGQPGETVTYPVTVGNCTDQPLAVALRMEPYGWEAMTATVEPSNLLLAAGESKPCVVRVKVSDRVPRGGHENQRLRAIANGDGAGAATLSFITASYLPHPYIIHTSSGWREVREKVQRYDWARSAQDRYMRQAERWQVPQVAKPPRNTNVNDNLGPFLFATAEESNIMACGYGWQLTRNTNFAEKAALFLRRLTDPQDGYPATLRGCNQGFVQEGHFMQHMAMAYDMISDAGVLTDRDRRQIEHTFRLYIESARLDLEAGAINNWAISQHCGAFYASLAMQDLVLAERFLWGPSGLIEQMSRGTMDDGWWYECSISYNIWCATEFSQIAIAMRPWGVNLVDAWMPASYSRNYGLVPWSMEPGLYGMNFDKFGPVTRTYVNLKRMWDALPVFADYRGVIFGINDTTEKPLTGSGYEIAYYLFRDPVYAGIIKRGRDRDLFYGVPELPEQTVDLSDRCAYADNVGVALLRSKAKTPRERIQAVLHYGTHGAYHGHFDRTSLLSVMRYGLSFYNPEMIWYGYQSFLYKFYVQTSMSKNMVVVDLKQQEPVESSRLLFHTGELMQVAAVETNARWSDPPFGGMRYPELPAATLEDKLWMEGRSFPIPTNAPPYGEIGPYSDRVLQRRLMIVTDDYLVLADYLKASESHTYDSLFQMKGFRGVSAANKRLLRHDGQMTTDARSAAQFITDCDWFEVASPARAKFEDAGLKMDVISLWPPRAEIMVGNAPETAPVNKKLWYAVRGDGQILAEGKFGAWVLGKVDIDVAVGDLKQLELETQVDSTERFTIFWANARIVMADGRELPLSTLPIQSDNIVQPTDAGKDYSGGPIKIVGVPYESVVPGQPAQRNSAGIVRVNLSSQRAVRFKATLGGDYPVGNENQWRKTYAIRTSGKDARFLTLIEPYETESVVRKLEATGPDKLRVELADGRVQEIQITNFEGNGRNLGVNLTESRDGKVIRSETTASPPETKHP
jgi:hypothetical protein